MDNIIVIHNFIINEIDNHLKLEKICKAIKCNGKRCTSKVNLDNLCKRHEKVQNIKLIQERKQFSCVLYHTHLPCNNFVQNCPKCNTLKDKV